MDFFKIVLGAILALTGGFINSGWERQRERRSIAHAFAGEIGAILEIVRRRHYQQGIEDMIQEVTRSRQPNFLNLNIHQNYFEVYQSNLNKIGFLPQNITADIATFYTFAKSIIEDVTTETTFPDADISIAALTELRDLIRDLVVLGEQLVPRLRAL